MAGNLDYFINKDYNKDLEGSQNKGRLLKTIDSFREKVKGFSKLRAWFDDCKGFKTDMADINLLKLAKTHKTK